MMKKILSLSVFTVGILVLGFMFLSNNDVTANTSRMLLQFDCSNPANQYPGGSCQFKAGDDDLNGYHDGLPTTVTHATNGLTYTQFPIENYHVKGANITALANAMCSDPLSSEAKQCFDDAEAALVTAHSTYANKMRDYWEQFTTGMELWALRLANGGNYDSADYNRDAGMSIASYTTGVSTATDTYEEAYKTIFEDLCECLGQAEGCEECPL